MTPDRDRLDALDAWVGRQETARDRIDARPARALAATLDHAPRDWPAGRALPPLWHWLYFLPLHRPSELGPDGHARRGGFMPPVPLPRRMWAGSRFEFEAPLRIGDEVERRSTIEQVAVKQGRSGTLAFVTVRHELTRAGDAAPALREWHDIVYRDAPAPGGAPGDAPAAPQPAPAQAAWRREIVPDDVLLFRYSALTFNSHRIHYDRRYVTDVEGYPGLVVHGPLVATLLLDLLHRHAGTAGLATFSFKALGPCFDQHALHLCGQPVDGAVRLWAQDHEGRLTMDASATLR